MATRTWDGSSNELWSSPFNWTPSGIPADGDDVVIVDATPFPQPTLDVDSKDLNDFTTQTDGDFSITSGARILKVSGNFVAAVNTINNAGTIKFDGTTAITSNGNDLDNIEITNGSTLTLQDDLTVNDILNNGTVDCNGFVLTIAGTPTGTGSYVGCGGSVAPYAEANKRTRQLLILGGYDGRRNMERRNQQRQDNA